MLMAGALLALTLKCNNMNDNVKESSRRFCIIDSSENMCVKYLL